MRPERRREIEALFEAALARPPGDRVVWLREACGGDVAVRREVVALLRAHELAGGFLERAPAPMASLAGLAPDLDRVGSYRVVGELGFGGMGTVYLGDRVEGGFRQRVAIKVLRRSADQAGLRRRFEAERQILATLDHPNIARLMDGGLTEDGRPFLVMEYVDGVPIDRYCAEAGLALEDRIRLLTTVARAVHHAHRQLIVHRDIKPSNILVTADGTPKLLDFGIAKILDPDALGYTAPATRASHRLMTPEYASPEQIRGDPVSTATDVYGLGLVLFELLTGRPPFRLDGRGAAEAERIVLEEPPPAPSAMSEKAATGRWRRGISRETGVSSVSEEKSLRGFELGSREVRRLRGDLDRIVLMALRKEPERRYESVLQLVRDLERFLAGRPVLAHGDSRLYRARMLIRRHRIKVTAVALVSLALLAGGITAAWQGARAARARDQARAALAQAERALDESRETAEFLLQVFDPDGIGGAEAASGRARELLDYGLSRVEELEDRPAAQARLLAVLGQVHHRMARYAEARPLLERALFLRRATFGEEHPEVAESLRDLALLTRAEGDYRATDSLFRAALAIQERVLGPSHPEVATTLHELGYFLTGTRHEESEAYLRRALAIREEAFGPDHPDVAQVLTTLAARERQRRAYDSAEAHLRRALSIVESSFGPRHRRVADVLLAVGRLLAYHLERPDEARPFFRRAAAITETALGPDHPRHAASLSNLADFYASRGHHDSALAVYRRVHAVQRKAYGPEHPLVAGVLGAISTELLALGKVEEAESVRRQELEAWKRIQGSRHVNVAGSLFGLADVLAAKGELDAAEDAACRALEIRAAAVGPAEPIVALHLGQLGRIRALRGDTAGAANLLGQAVRIGAGYYGRRHPDMRPIVRELERLEEATYEREPLDEEREVGTR